MGLVYTLLETRFIPCARLRDLPVWKTSGGKLSDLIQMSRSVTCHGDRDINTLRDGRRSRKCVLHIPTYSPGPSDTHRPSVVSVYRNSTELRKSSSADSHLFSGLRNVSITQNFMSVRNSL